MSETNGYVKPEALFGAAPKRRFTDFECELGKFRLRNLMAGEAAEYAMGRLNNEGGLSRKGVLTSNARIIVLCCVDGEGNAIFTQADIARLQTLPAGPIAQLAEACLTHCGLTEAEEEAKN